MDENSLCMFKEEMYRRLQNVADMNISDLNEMMTDVANTMLKATSAEGT